MTHVHYTYSFETNSEVFEHLCCCH